MAAADPSELGPVRGLTRTLAHLERDASAVAAIMKIRFYPFVLARAEGVHLFDLDGNAYLDFIAGASVMNIGYADPAVRAAAIAAMDGPWSTTSAIFAHPAQTELAERLAALLEPEAKAWFGTSGSEALDAMARYFRKASGRSHIVSFKGSFHGQTGGSGALSGLLPESDFPDARVTKVPFPNPYRCTWGPCARAGCSLRCLGPLKEAVDEAGSDLAGVVTEPIQSDGGDVIPPDNVLPALREICDRAGAWLGLDEVKVGLGRTGSLLAHDRASVRPDAIAFGKALGGGFPLSALVARREIVDAETGACAYTLAGSPVACAAGLASWDELERGAIANAAAVGATLAAELEARLAPFGIVGDVRCRGLLAGIEIVAGPGSNEPAGRLAAAIVYRCFELGLITIYVGAPGNVIELTPPLTITADQARTGARIIERAVAEVEAGAFDEAKLAAFPGW